MVSTQNQEVIKLNIKKCLKTLNDLQCTSNYAIEASKREI